MLVIVHNNTPCWPVMHEVAMSGAKGVVALAADAKTLFRGAQTSSNVARSIHALFVNKSSIREKTAVATCILIVS